MSLALNRIQPLSAISLGVTAVTASAICYVNPRVFFEGTLVALFVGVIKGTYEANQYRNGCKAALEKRTDVKHEVIKTNAISGLHPIPRVISLIWTGAFVFAEVNQLDVPHSLLPWKIFLVMPLGYQAGMFVARIWIAPRLLPEAQRGEFIQALNRQKL